MQTAGNGVFFVVKECLKSLVPRRMRDGSAAGSDAMRRLSSADGSSPSHFVGLLPWRTYKERKQTGLLSNSYISRLMVSPAERRNIHWLAREEKMG